MNLVNPTHLDQFCAILSGVLQEELAKGNRVVETASGWPKPQTIMVFLEKPFIGDYRHLPLTYTDVNDPHYWRADYLDERSWHILACKFGDTF